MVESKYSEEERAAQFKELCEKMRASKNEHLEKVNLELQYGKKVAKIALSGGTSGLVFSSLGLLFVTVNVLQSLWLGVGVFDNIVAVIISLVFSRLAKRRLNLSIYSGWNARKVLTKIFNITALVFRIALLVITAASIAGFDVAYYLGIRQLTQEEILSFFNVNF